MKEHELRNMESMYLDNASAMAIDPRVLDFAIKYLKTDLGNPSSLHATGLEAKSAIEVARVKIAELINAEKPEALIFTGSATEANNIAIKGTAQRNMNKGKKVVSSSVEHISVINPMKDLQKIEFTYETIPVDEYGIIKLENLKEIVTSETTVTSIMYANGEIGTIEPIKEASEIVHENGLYLHVDATMANGHLPIDVQDAGIDLLTLSSNTMAGPQGAGALYIKPGVKIQPVILGGGQERGLRSGTENIFAIAGMGEASRIANSEMGSEADRLQKIRDKLIDEILKIDNSYLTGHRTQRLPNHASFRFDHIEGESILLNMDMYSIQVSTGSACSSKTLEPSHVLLAIGLSHEQAHGSMVLSLGKQNKIDEVPKVVEAISETVERLRKLSPLA
jgi:cysteine desulfurase